MKRWLLLGSALILARPAQALVTCTASATGVAFGIYDPLNATPAVSTGSISVTCTLLSGGGTTVAVQADLSTGTSGSFVTRTMLSGINVLNYNLYLNTAHTDVWGDGNDETFSGFGNLTITPSRPTNAVSLTMYGLVPASQDPRPGTFIDTIIVTITY